jgi:hypothetical protein
MQSDLSISKQLNSIMYADLFKKIKHAKYLYFKVKQIEKSQVLNQKQKRSLETSPLTLSINQAIHSILYYII